MIFLTQKSQNHENVKSRESEVLSRLFYSLFGFYVKKIITFA